MKRKRHGGIEAIKRRYGYYFVAHWVIGVILFVIIPLFTSFYYGFSSTVMTGDGLATTFVGLDNYRNLFLKDPYYINQIMESLSSLFTSLPIVVALSMTLALVLNQKFKGRTLARAVFFLPVIIGSSVVMSQLSGFSMQQDIMASSGVGGEQQVAEYMNVIDFNALLQRLNLPSSINSLLAGYLQDTFNLIWSCGIQILLFVAGLQTIPEQLYEVGKVEGITAWEKFWYITVPMMGRVILLVIFYTMVELFMEKGTLVNRAVTTLMEQNYTTSSAMLWPYFALVGIIIGLVVFLYNRWCLRRWE
jgi:ABC transporter, permease protein